MLPESVVKDICVEFAYIVQWMPKPDSLIRKGQKSVCGRCLQLLGFFFVLVWLFVCFLLFEIILFLPSLFFPSNFARGLSSGSSMGIN